MNSMYPQHLKYLHDKNIIWYNPSWVYLAFWQKFRKLRGNNPSKDFYSIWFGREMKENKEIYFAALAAICFRKIDPQNEGWWVTKVEQDPPDALILTPITIDGRKDARVREIEVVEFITGSVEETIERKLKKAYQEDIFLFCYLSPKTTEILSFQKISKNIIAKNPSIESIYLLSIGVLPEEIALNEELSEEEIIKEVSKITLIQISPFYNEARIDSEEDFASFLNGSEMAYLRFDGRGKDPDWRKVSESVPNPIK